MSVGEHQADRGSRCAPECTGHAAVGMELPGERVAPVLGGYSAVMSGIT